MAVLATEQQMMQLDQGMMELEEMVKDVEAVSSVLEFNSTSLASTSKGTFTAANKGAAMLASEVGEQLRFWRQQREDLFVQLSREHCNKLKEVVATFRNVELDRSRVRDVVRWKILKDAEELMARKVPDLLTKPAEKNNPANPEGVGRVPAALNTLRKKLEGLISPVEAMRPDRPIEMVAASEIAATALERKKMRIQVQQQSLPAMASSLDAELLEEADNNLAARKEAIVQQYERQVSTVKRIKASMKDRQEAFEELAARQRSGPPPVPEEHWQCLWPPSSRAQRFGPGSENGAGDSGGEPLPARLTTLPEGPDVEELQRSLRQRGEARLEEIAADFKKKHLSFTETTQQAEDVKAELEMWMLATRQELLDDLRNSVKHSHEDVLQSLRLSLEMSTASPEEQKNGAVAAGQNFNKHKNDSMSDVMGSAEAKLTSILKHDREMFQAWRRRAELTALKRWSDTPNGIDDAGLKAQAAALVQLGEMTQRLVQDCHVALPLPQDDFKPTGKSIPQGATGAVGNLFMAWDRYNTPIGERLSVAERVVDALPDTVETCAVAKAALCLVDEEMQRLIQRLKENPYPLLGKGKVERDQILRRAPAAR
eukprot:TRINITY_DN57918_c0_g1_i1.p1 TRINITY_DN57918_c0_g1~~TRINITY_DN57918_c0_g1_i1.p1  ORF type:complete len:599 (+),score=201.59 TRINITY_DN57918_c0_g1_i1:131-1927(+)